MPNDILDDDKDERDGLDEPLADVGPEECAPKPIDCEVEASDTPEDHPGASEVSFRDEIAEQFPVVRIPVGASPEDGLPLPLDGGRLATAIRFDYEHFICMEDDREYVELFDDEMSEDGRHQTALARHASMSAPFSLSVRAQYDSNGMSPFVRRTFKPSEVVTLWGVPWVREATPDLSLTPVRFKRERCKFYKRQVMPNDERSATTAAAAPLDFENKDYSRLVFRNCTMRRSVGGAYMSIANEGVYVCDYREPRDLVSEKAQDDEDRRAASKKPENVPLFNIKPKPTTEVPS